MAGIVAGGGGAASKPPRYQQLDVRRWQREGAPGALWILRVWRLETLRNAA